MSRRRKIIISLIAIDLIVIAIVIGLVRHYRDNAEKQNVVNPGYIGSTPPYHQRLVDLSDLPTIQPRVPSNPLRKDRVSVVIVTCLDCRSGDIIGRALATIMPKLDTQIDILVFSWDGSVAEWKKQSGLPMEQKFDNRFVQYHDSASSAKSPLQSRLAIGESGFLYIHDRQGYRRSSFTVGQMIADDVIHDIDKVMSLKAD